MSSPASPTPTVTLEYRGRIAIITLNNAKKLNAMGSADYQSVARFLREVAGRDEVFITILTGKGRFFSAGADVSLGRDLPPNTDLTTHFLSTFVPNNLNITQAFYTHPKILITALNGPAIGLSAALTAWSDFIYSTPHAYLLTPFSSIGLVTEGGASIAFVERLGISKANEALLMSRKITAEEMVQTGFVNKVFEVGEGEGADERFLEKVLEEVKEMLGTHLVQSSLLEIKALIRRPGRDVAERQNFVEVMKGLERFAAGIPQAEFKKLASGEKRHKL